MTQYPTLTAFMKQFHDTESCQAYLSNEKWARGFSCRKCGHEASVKGKKELHRRCQKCLYHESPTAHTIFHKLKIPIECVFAWFTCNPQFAKVLARVSLLANSGFTRKPLGFSSAKYSEG